MVEKPVPHIFTAKWNNHKSKLRIELPDDPSITHGDIYECYVQKNGSILYKRLGDNHNG